MKILILSLEGDGFSLAYALKKGGDDVRIYSKNKELNLAMLGLIDKTDQLLESVRWADLVISDMVGMGNIEWKLKRIDTPYLSTNLVMDALELDRKKQMDLMRRVGIRLPPTFEFNNPSEAKSVIQHWSDPGYVIKPSGNLNTASTMVCRNERTYLWALDQFASDQELVIQKIIEGIEVSTEGWFNGQEWVHFNHTFEEKRFLVGDLGQNVGCMGNVVYEGRPESVLSQELQKLTGFLQTAKYRGPIDLNTIVNESGSHALEITPRFGYDAVEALWAMSDRSKFSSFLLSVAKGENEPLALTYMYGMSIRISLPPYPMAELDPDDSGLPIEVSDEEGILWSDAYTDGGKLFSAGFDGVLAKVVGAGDDVMEAQIEAYTRVRRVEALNLQYRIDIGKRVPTAESTLVSFGVI